MLIVVYHPQVLYQYVFVKGEIDTPFGLLTLYPRKLLDANSEEPIESIQGSVLAVDVNGDDPGYFDPVKMLNEVITCV